MHRLSSLSRLVASAFKSIFTLTDFEMTRQRQEPNQAPIFLISLNPLLYLTTFNYFKWKITNLDARKISRAGTLHVIQAHALIYINITNLTLFRAGSNGAKKRPSQIIPWLLIICNTFSATLNSPYSGCKQIKQTDILTLWQYWNSELIVHNYL